MDSENATRWTGPTACPGGAANLAERERVVRRRRVFTARRTRAAQGLNVCRAGFAGRGTACARSADATRSRPGPTRDKGLGSSICPAGSLLLNASGSPTSLIATHFVSLTVAVFYLLAAITVGSALGVALSHSIVYSAFALMGTLLGVAAMFVLLGADFLGVVQLLVYVGGILVLTLFAVMLTHRISDVNVSNRAVGRLPAAVLVGIAF